MKFKFVKRLTKITWYKTQTYQCNEQIIDLLCYKDDKTLYLAHRECYWCTPNIESLGIDNY